MARTVPLLLLVFHGLATPAAGFGGWHSIFYAPNDDYFDDEYADDGGWHHHQHHSDPKKTSWNATSPSLATAAADPAPAATTTNTPWWDATPPAPTPAPPGSVVVAPDTVTVLQMETTMRMCSVVCGAFETDPGVIVNTDGRFKSSGERAVAYAITTNVDGVQPGTSMHSVSFVEVLWFNESIATRDVTSCSKDVCATKQVDVCSTTARIGAQIDLAKGPNPPIVGEGLSMRDSAVNDFALELTLQLEDAANTNALAQSMNALGLGVGTFCWPPRDTQFSVKDLPLPSTVQLAHEFERCKDQLARVGPRRMSGQCRKELHAMMILVGVVAFFTFMGCVKVFESCRCDEAKTRRQRLQDQKVLGNMVGSSTSMGLNESRSSQRKGDHRRLPRHDYDDEEY